MLLSSFRIDDGSGGFSLSVPSEMLDKKLKAVGLELFRLDLRLLVVPIGKCWLKKIALVKNIFLQSNQARQS
jgi:hypothetical protein